MDSSGARRVHVLAVTENGKEKDSARRPGMGSPSALPADDRGKETSDSPVSSESRGTMEQRSPSSALIFSWRNRRREGRRSVSDLANL